jgi:hypothetical protein
MSDTLRYHTVDELESLSHEALNTLWELVPTERQRIYRATYEREVRGAGAAGSDLLELRVAEELLHRYVETALVPIGARWARTPGRVQAAAQQDEHLSAPEETTVNYSPNPLRKSAILAMLLVVSVFGFMMLRLLGGATNNSNAISTTSSPIPATSLTPTALALEEQDDVIQGGDRARETAYPVSLQMSNGSAPPRVWVVQRRRVDTSEWNYDLNPDTASFISGMVVRPIIGIPWSEDNELSFEQIDESTVFTLIMNTGAALRFEYSTRRDVLRSDTDIFRQIEPGLALLLIGKTDEEGMFTATRTLITATYSAEQELTRSGEIAESLHLPPVIVTPSPTATASPTAIPFADVSVQIIEVTTSSNELQLGQITTRLRLYNGGLLPITITADDIWLALGYIESPPGPRVPPEGLASFDLLPSQAADLTLTWMWKGEPYATLAIAAWQFALEF